MKEIISYIDNYQKKIEGYETRKDVEAGLIKFNEGLKKFKDTNDMAKREYIDTEQRVMNGLYLSKKAEFMKYGNISKYRNELNRRTDINDSLEIMYSIDTFFETEVYKTYETFLKVAKEKGFKRVFDIGCAYGLQSEVFVDTNVEYVGINEDNIFFWNNDKYRYIVDRYPFEISTNKDTDLAVSSLCLTWNCYLYEGDKTLLEQCTALSRDFDNVILYMQMDKLEFVAEFFKGHEIIEGNIVYFYN